MKKVLEISLGVVTSVGGFLEVGSLTTAVQAGAAFHFQLIWAIVLGTICIIFLVEMAGRFAAVSHHTIADGIRERFGFNAFLWPLLAVLLVNLLVMSAEIGGVAIALELATGIGFQWWALLVALLAWVLLWKGTFGFIEKGVSILGLVTLCFVVGAVMLKPDWGQVAAGAIPIVPNHDAANYWFMAVSILGASISPYLFMFYSSGAIEDRWDESYLGANRAIAAMGMSFGGTISVSVLIVAALVLAPHGIDQVDDYHQLPLILIPIFGFWGFVLFIASLGIACFGAVLEVGLQQAYLVAQGFGWTWGEDQKPRDNPGFSTVYTVALFLSALPIAAGLDPLKLTIFSMALTAASLPLSVVPFLFLMNDKRYVGKHRNGMVSNAAVIFVIALGFVLAIVAIPLQIFGGT
ncbi:MULTISPECIES: divalent metal cation transporter [unclassified Mesorhizobium]|uniref:NRAMP family divalent metal transporter n=1 Tax=unclassified Mesorhizobium TaxID=325217 RepID=UPI000FCCB328|nr:MULTISPECIES: divalent metal cation transporter [unclassified Mesorhizobium]TIT75276.1 MAG: divalent metal cation transporter [Mesorhizobium sp.]TGP18078.1 divalent metal cation transporter [Mesorhizobium sp. M1D.F.Ca.ET.231.01.1.1]TGP25380.1 divalent metal cation transporter [Mesorhizobium sp. M1D.F.Ca.ET.234.01.1.1]TGS37846.1 divalent metal cation transporter [Mesorhizobium sp. M1D.F.Ca.ET.184.01.1.1]TGS58199.1 divalent metal cation transporter [Mesorhizobium sp. M1D.F.Ca.ET.183.01.1.1]